jgi:hypothetical protein
VYPDVDSQGPGQLVALQVSPSVLTRPFQVVRYILARLDNAKPADDEVIDNAKAAGEEKPAAKATMKNPYFSRMFAPLVEIER